MIQIHVAGRIVYRLQRFPALAHWDGCRMPKTYLITTVYSNHGPNLFQSQVKKGPCAMNQNAKRPFPNARASSTTQSLLVGFLACS